ncbi:MAG: SRPBCC family protein [Nitriliruptorales bacterium]|nr:SRPBCC family protein [Nitriliruptorales bacterium]
MYELHETRMVKGKSPREVFDYVADPDKGALWNSAAKSVRAEGDPGVGRRLIASAGILAFTFDITQEVTVWDPPNAYSWAGDSPVHTRFDMRFTEVEGGTELTADVEFDPKKLVPGLMKGKVANKFMGDFKKDLDTLVKLIEAT